MAGESYRLQLKLVRMNQNVLVFLLCLAFAGIGFSVGRVTAPAGRGHDVSVEDVEMLIAGVESGAVDTVIAIPAGEVKILREGEMVHVTVEEGSAPGKRVIERHVVIETED